MNICDKCRALCRESCPICESRRRVRTLKPDDHVFLCTLTAMQTMFVEPVLKDSGIPYLKQGLLGAGLSASWGMMLESNKIYVPYAAYDRCRALMEEVFGEDEDIMRLIHEYDAELEA